MPPLLLKEVLNSVEDVSSALNLRLVPENCGATQALVLEQSGVRDLWEAGVHPSKIPALARHAQVVGRLPVSYYLAMTYGEVDLAWFRRTIAHRPDPTVAAWLAWTPPTHSLVCEEVSEWLGMGLGRLHIEALVGRSISPNDARPIALATGRSLHAAAIDLANWAIVDCQPNTAHFVLMDRSGVGGNHPPSGAAVDALVAATERTPRCPGRTELGVLLALAGTRSEAERVLALGIRSAAEWCASTAIDVQVRSN